MTGSSGELLDEQARQEYAQRFRELQEEFRKARENDDLAKIETLEREMEELTHAVTEATGLGGRSRQNTDIEKVRKSVREAISRDIRRISKKHEALGNHLATFIDTGLTCRYIPEPLDEWVTYAPRIPAIHAEHDAGIVHSCTCPRKKARKTSLVWIAATCPSDSKRLIIIDDGLPVGCIRRKLRNCERQNSAFREAIFQLSTINWSLRCDVVLF
jgi:hypothetical protein